MHISGVTTLVHPQSQLKCTACVRSASVIHKSDHPRCCYQISPDEELKICSEVLRHNRIVLNSFIKWYISFGSGRDDTCPSSPTAPSTQVLLSRPSGVSSYNPGFADLWSTQSLDRPLVHLTVAVIIVSSTARRLE